jgi:hypothetical protein
MEKECGIKQRKFIYMANEVLITFFLILQNADGSSENGTYSPQADRRSILDERKPN